MRRLVGFVRKPSVCLFGPITAAVLYFVSLGPVIWVAFHVHLPRWAAVLLIWYFVPIDWINHKSELASTVFFEYADFYVDTSTKAVIDEHDDLSSPDQPPYVVEVSGTLLGAWLVWSFVRWMNQRKVAAPLES